MTLVNTCSPSGDTYFGANGNSRLDYQYVDSACLSNVVDCRVLEVKGDQLQLVRSAKKVDHFPLLVRYQIEHPMSKKPEADDNETTNATKPTMPEPTKWNKDALMLLAPKGHRRAELIERIKTYVRDPVVSISLRHSDTAAQMWHIVNHGVHAIARKMFSAEPTSKNKKCFPMKGFSY